MASKVICMSQLFKNQKGFTLIELMIVVAIIGILASIAINSYQRYTARAQISEAMELMGSHKTAVAEWYATTGQWPSSAASILESKEGKYVQSIGISTKGSIFSFISTMRGAGSVNAPLINKTIVLQTDDGARTWECLVGGPNPVESIYVPAACR